MTVKRPGRARGSAPVGSAAPAKVFLDSGIFIALLDRSDTFHQSATRLFSGPRPHWSTSMAVVSETYGWFLHRLGESAARTFRMALADLTGLRLYALDEWLHRATQAKLDRLRGHKLTYVDAASLALLAHHKIGTVWGTDADLAIEGARLLPQE